MTDAGRSLQTPRRGNATRKPLLLASLFGATPGFVVASGLLLLGHSGSGQAWLAGTVILLLPQLWFVTRGTRTTQLSGAAALALARYSLVAAGYALWFALRPDAGLFATLAGSMLTLVATAVAIARLQRHATTH